MQWRTTSDEVTASLSAISEFVAETETLIPAAQLDGDEELWSESGQGSTQGGRGAVRARYPDPAGYFES